MGLPLTPFPRWNIVVAIWCCELIFCRSGGGGARVRAAPGGAGGGAVIILV